MVIVKLKSMRLKNWKGADDETYNFQPGINDITERNGEGKTRRAEAFTWAFWGKDLLDRVNYRIKNEKYPEKRKFDSIVDLELDVNGRDQQIARIYSENWVRPKGKEEEVLKGNSTSYVVNGDESYNKTQFDTFVSSWFDETLFKMLTNPLFFNTDGAKWEWRNRRDILIQIAGEIDSDMVFEEAKDISAARRKLLEEQLAQGKDFDSYKREIQGKKKKANEELEGVPQSIKKLEEVQPEKVDWDRLDDLIEFADKEYEEANNLFNDKSKVGDVLEAKLADIRKDIRDAQQDADEEEAKIKIKLKAENDLIRLNRQVLQADVTRLKDRVALLTKANDGLIARMKAAERDNADAVTRYTEKKQEAEPELDPKDAECEFCGTHFDDDKIAEKHQQIIDNWRTQRAVDMKALKKLAQDKFDEYTEFKKGVSKAQQEIDEVNKDLAQKEAELKAENDKELAGAKELADRLENSEPYQDAKLRVSNLEEALKIAIANSKDSDTEEEIAKLEEYRKKADEERLRLRAKKSTKETYDKIEKEIKELKQKEKNLNKTIADLEGLEFAITKYNAARNEVVTKRVNRLFRTDAQGRSVRFQLFRPNADGTEQIEHCELWFDNKPYSALNTAAKTWAGMECINAFNQYYDMYLPVWLDNRESVNDVPPLDARVQIINLRVLSEAPPPVVVTPEQEGPVNSSSEF